MSRRRTYYSEEGFEVGQFMAIVGINSNSYLRYYYSTNYGETWTPGDYFGFPDSVAAIAASPKIKYIAGGMATLVMNSSNGIGSVNFSVNDISHLSSGRFQKISMSDTGQYQMFKSYANSNAATSYTYGGVWSNKSLSSASGDSYLSNDVYVSTSGKYQAICCKNSYYYYSSDFGVNWTKVTPGVSFVGDKIYNYTRTSDESTQTGGIEVVRSNTGIYTKSVGPGNYWMRVYSQSNPASIDTNGIGFLSISDDGFVILSSLTHARTVTVKNSQVSPDVRYVTTNGTDYASDLAYASAMSRDGYCGLSFVSDNTDTRMYLMKQYGSLWTPITGLDLEEVYTAIVI